MPAQDVIKPVSPKGNPPWSFTGRTDAEAKAPTHWPPDEENWLPGKDPDAGKAWGQEKVGNRGQDGCTASPTWCTWVWTNSGRQWRTGKPGTLQTMESKRVGHDWVTEQQQVIRATRLVRTLGFPHLRSACLSGLAGKPRAELDGTRTGLLSLSPLLCLSGANRSPD